MIPIRLQTAIDQYLTEVSSFYRWFFIVHPKHRRLAEMTTDLQATYGWPCISLGRQLTPQLVPLPPFQRTNRIAQLAGDILSNQQGPLILTDVDVLCDPALNVAPLTILGSISRRVPLIIMWPGSYIPSTLIYAQSSHEHTRMYESADLAPSRVFVL